MEMLLPKEKFLRIHRSFIVGKERITAFTSVAAEISGKSLPIGRSYRDLVQQILSK
jgi:DNA-binding LytR/AlgR family response regulator